jgi:3-dehydroquinate dehydratase-1
MAVCRSAVLSSSTPNIVGVIFSQADLQRAIRMRRPPDFFELRLDALISSIDETRAAAAHLRAPIIVTARHPREGGLNQLSSRQRCALLLSFLVHAAAVDVELRSAGALATVLEQARARKIGRIISFHDFDRTPSAARLDQIVAEARSAGADIVKVAVRTETPPEVAALLHFFQRHRSTTPLAVMGVGPLGALSRRALARQGSALNYAALASEPIEGQPSLVELRRSLGWKI